MSLTRVYDSDSDEKGLPSILTSITRVKYPGGYDGVEVDNFKGFRGCQTILAKDNVCRHCGDGQSKILIYYNPLKELYMTVVYFTGCQSYSDDVGVAYVTDDMIQLTNYIKKKHNISKKIIKKKIQVAIHNVDPDSSDNDD